MREDALTAVDAHEIAQNSAEIIDRSFPSTASLSSVKSTSGLGRTDIPAFIRSKTNRLQLRNLLHVESSAMATADNNNNNELLSANGQNSLQSAKEIDKSAHNTPENNAVPSMPDDLSKSSWSGSTLAAIVSSIVIVIVLLVVAFVICSRRVAAHGKINQRNRNRNSVDTSPLSKTTLGNTSTPAQYSHTFSTQRNSQGNAVDSLDFLHSLSPTDPTIITPVHQQLPAPLDVSSWKVQSRRLYWHSDYEVNTVGMNMLRTSHSSARDHPSQSFAEATSSAKSMPSSTLRRRSVVTTLNRTSYMNHQTSTSIEDILVHAAKSSSNLDDLSTVSQYPRSDPILGIFSTSPTNNNDNETNTITVTSLLSPAQLASTSHRHRLSTLDLTQLDPFIIHNGSRSAPGSLLRAVMAVDTNGYHTTEEYNKTTSQQEIVTQESLSRWVFQTFCSGTTSSSAQLEEDLEFLSSPETIHNTILSDKNVHIP